MRGGTADRLPLPDGDMDIAVAGLVRCDQASALTELYRVLRPGGELRFGEEVTPRCQRKRMLLEFGDRSGLWPAVAGGCRPARDTGAAIESDGARSNAASGRLSAPAPSSRARTSAGCAVP